MIASQTPASFPPIDHPSFSSFSSSEETDTPLPEQVPFPDIVEPEQEEEEREPRKKERPVAPPAALQEENETPVDSPPEGNVSPTNTLGELAEETSITHTANTLPSALAQPQQTLRDFMITNSIKGHKPMRARTPFLGEITTITSPSDPEASFGIKRLTNRDVMTYRNSNSVVRYISEADGDRYTQERDFPMGDMRLLTITLGLATWNLTDEAGKALDVTRDNILDYLDRSEFDFVYDQVLDLNPILAGREDVKNDSKDSSDPS